MYKLVVCFCACMMMYVCCMYVVFMLYVCCIYVLYVGRFVSCRTIMVKLHH